MSLTATRSSCNFRGAQLLDVTYQSPLWKWIHTTHSKLISIRIQLDPEAHSRWKSMLSVRTIGQYSKCYNTIRHLKPHPLHVCQIVIFSYFISVHMKYRLVLSTDRIYETILLLLQSYKVFPLNRAFFP